MEAIGDLPVNVFDIGVIAVLLVSALLAYARGFVHEVLAIVGWIGAIFATFYGFPYAQPYARRVIALDLAADLAAGVIIFIFTLVFLSMMTRAVSRKVQDSALNALDRALGFLFGLLRGALIVVIAYIGLELVMPRDNQPAFIQEARAMQLIEPAKTELLAMLPDRYGGTKEEDDKAKEGAADTPGRVIMDIITPKPKAAPESDAGGAPEGYGKDQRQEMERLIGNTKNQ